MEPLGIGGYKQEPPRESPCETFVEISLNPKDET